MQAVFSLAFVLGVLVAITIAGGPPSEEKKKIIDECKAQEKATDDDVQQLMSHKLPNGPNGKCFLACINEKTGVIKDGKINGDMLKANILKENGGNEKAAGSVNEMVAECQGINNPQRCELAFQLMDCMMKSYAKYGNPKQM
ncbi:general odorant-binding protein 19d-like [Sitodiplosis mosellana]|uniref:general odorant-binding protein 19d-like n=1 Tax=Sitodiplosis mosellana TaxID=263140 RepID=UPI00244482C0|nr:general odorant-binding protein 19d-like [Sitodiplosis mosellana]